MNKPILLGACIASFIGVVFIASNIFIGKKSNPLAEFYQTPPGEMQVRVTDNITHISHKPAQASSTLGTDKAKAPPAITKKTMHEKFTLLLPNTSEQQMKETADAEKISFLLEHLNETVLDSLVKDYGRHPERALQDMGIPKNCQQEDNCTYLVTDGPVLAIGQSFGLELGDEIVAINDVAVSIIPSYSHFKNIIFSNDEFMDVTIQREGQILILRFG